MNIKKIIREEVQKVLKESDYYPNLSADDVNDLLEELLDYANQLKFENDNAYIYNDSNERSYWNGNISAKNEVGTSLLKILEKYKR